MDAPGAPLSNSLVTFTTILLLWTTTLTAIRTWAKSQQYWSWFDAVFAAAYIVCVGQCTAIYLAIAQYGFGQDWKQIAAADETSWKKALYASEILYLLCMGLSKASTLFFLNGLSLDRRQKKIGFALASLIAAWSTGALLSVAVRGKMLPSAPWASITLPLARWLVVEVLGLVLEVCIWLFAVALIWPLHMQLSRRLKLLSLFGVRLLLIPLVAVRLWRLSLQSHNVSVATIVYAQITTEVVMHFALISECMTCLKPFLQTFHEGLPASGNGGSYWRGLTTMSHRRSVPTNGVANEVKSGSRLSHKGYRRREQTEEDELRLRSDEASFETRVEVHDNHKEGRGNVRDEIELLPSSRIRVEQTTTLSTS